MAGTSKKGSRTARTTKRPTQKEQQANSKAKKQMWSVVLFALGVLFLCFTLIPGEKLWRSIHNVLFGTLGWSVYFLAPLMLYIAVIAALDRPLTALRAKLWQVAILILMISAAIQIVGPGLPDEGGFVDNLAALWESGKALEGGGIAGMLFAWPLLGLFEKTGATIIIGLAIFVFLMLITGQSLVSLFHSLTKPVRGIEEAYADAVEQRRSRPERPVRQRERDSRPPALMTPALAAKAGKFSFDVDISGDSEPEEREEADPGFEPVMPEHPVISSLPEEAPAFFAAPQDTPVEYISPELFASALSGKEEAEEMPVIRHPLSDEIARAESAAERQNAEISELIDRFLNPKQRELAVSAPEREERAAPPEMILVEGAKKKPAPKDSVGFSLSRAERKAEPARPAPIQVVPARETASARDAASTWEAASVREAAPDRPVLERIPAEPPLPQEYRHPLVGLLSTPKTVSDVDVSEELKQNAQTLVDTLRSFGVQTRITDISRGPAVTRYELQPSAGVKISKITGLADDIALNLASAGIRIEAPIPNKAAVGIEVPNKTVSTVSIREIIDSKEFSAAGSSLSVAMGKDIAGNIILADLGTMPHLLIAGSTGSGKSVCINSIIVSLLYKSTPEEVKLLMVDPKVVELGIYNGIPHLLVPVVTDPRKAAGALGWAVAEMLKRYKTFAENNVRDLGGYNRLAAQDGELSPMPKIVIIIDELADLMMAAPGEVEDSICRLAQMARAAGMHLVIATQRPSVDVITGVIKANIPSRIAFAVSSMVDSRTILDMGGAEKLLGRGDMLFYPVGAAKPVRVQGCFVTDTEVEQVVNFVKAGDATDYDQDVAEDIERLAVAEKKKGKAAQDDGGGFDDEDEMLPQAIECVVEMGMASTSSLQRRLKLGYARAARLIDQMEQKGIVGPFEGSKPRQVLLTRDRWMEMKLSSPDEAPKQLTFESEEAPF